jgi:hypothetical protein
VSTYYKAGLGSLLLPDKQVDRIDSMRKDTLDRIETTARGVSHAVLAGSVITALSTAVLIKNAYNMRRGR